MPAIPLAQAAQLLGITCRTLERHISRGAPVARRGGRGRGRTTLIDVEAVLAWRRSRDAVVAADALLILSAEIPELIATALYDAHTLADGAHKKDFAGALAGAWYVVTTALLDRLRKDSANIPDVTATPEKITKLCRIFQQ